ncbi:MAG TPA: SulP family inorganic anion transporter [Gemmataceae bacterium]|nr:SulP family inorganic anion transporter [Gemmataceae bacterium]
MRSAIPSDATEARLPEEVPAVEEAAQPSDWRRSLERLFRVVPALDSLRSYSLRALRLDSQAGLTVAAVAVPQAMAYASIAGLPPQYGLYTAIVMTAVGALFDSSRQLINGPTNAICIALFSVLSAVPPEQQASCAVLLALLVGVAQSGITLLRLGDLTRYISHAVIVGFTLGAAVLLVLDQSKNLLGLPAGGQGSDHFLVRFGLTMSHVGALNWYTTAIGVGTIVVVLLLRRLSARLGVRLPELLLAVLAAAALVWACGWDGQGVTTIGELPRSLPGFAPPEVTLQRVRELAGGALAIALLGLLEAIAMAKAIAAQTGQKLDINQQCLSEGLANLTGSFFHCFPGSGSLTRSAINQQAGAVSQWSGVIAAVAVAATVFFFAPVAKYIPRAALAGILMVSAAQLVNRQQLLYHLRATRFDLLIVVATALAAVLVSVEFCILIGIFLSFILYVPRAAKVDLTELILTPERVILERLPQHEACGRMLLFNLEGELFFGSAPDLEGHLATIDKRAGPEVRVVVLRLKRVRNPDAVCLVLIDAFLSRLEARGVKVLLCGVRHDLAKVLRSTGLEGRLAGRLFLEVLGPSSSTLDAVRHAYELLGSDVCPTCPRRHEAANREGWYYMI